MTKHERIAIRKGNHILIGNNPWDVTCETIRNWTQTERETSTNGQFIDLICNVVLICSFAITLISESGRVLTLLIDNCGSMNITAMSKPEINEEKEQAIPLTRDPEAPPLTPLDEEEVDAPVHNAATLEQNQTVTSNRRHDKR